MKRIDNPVRSLFLLFVVALVIWLVFNMGNQLSITKLNSTQFNTALEGNTINYIEIRQNSQTPTGEAIIYFKDANEYGRGEVHYFVSDVNELTKTLAGKNITYILDDVPSDGIFTNIILPIALTTIIVMFLIMYMNSRMAAGGSAGNSKMMNFGKSRAKIAKVGDINFSKVAGLEEEKEELEEVVDFLKDPRKYKELGARIPKGMLLVGPPGTGKTSIAKSVARAMDKKYVRISLGGVRDEAEIRGHRRTYVGAMPGRIVEAIKNAKVSNPLLLLDEIDKSSRDYKGDVSSALLEVLDGEQNKTFRDRYLEIPLDLSKVLFIATANTLDTIPRPLLDRMDIIEISSYTENEKYHIAKKYLIPKEVEANGLSDIEISFSDKAIKKVIHNYTREAGVRNLSRRIGDICRKCARESLEGKKKFKITEKSVYKYLGKEKVRFDEIEKEPQVGVVTGLAWTSVGGDTLSIEVNIMPGKGVLTLTGNMGDVMKESAGIAKSLVRSMAEEYSIAEGFFEKHDIHLHIPEGAVPKDGPSAGVTMTTALISAITERKVRADVAMTGEITLRGKVLAIGGLKEKLLAAKLAGVKTVCVPKENEADIAELSGEITGGLEIVYVRDIKEVLSTALI